MFTKYTINNINNCSKLCQILRKQKHHKNLHIEALEKLLMICKAANVKNMMHPISLTIDTWNIQKRNTLIKQHVEKSPPRQFSDVET